MRFDDFTTMLFVCVNDTQMGDRVPPPPSLQPDISRVLTPPEGLSVASVSAAAAGGETSKRGS